MPPSAYPAPFDSPAGLPLLVGHDREVSDAMATEAQRAMALLEQRNPVLTRTRHSTVDSAPRPLRPSKEGSTRHTSAHPLRRAHERLRPPDVRLK